MKHFFILLAVLGLLLTVTVVAQVPNKISYQGLLTTSSGTPVQDGSYDLQFKLFTVSSGGNALWTETKTGVQVQKGTFSVILTGLNLPFDSTYYLEVTATSGPTGPSYPITFSPRSEFTSSPYALHADTANYAKASPGGGAGGWTDDGTVVRLTTITDNVGIGTTSPSFKFDVVGSGGLIKAKGTANSNPEIQVVDAGGGSGRMGIAIANNIVSNALEDALVITNDQGPLQLGTATIAPSSARLTINTSGNVGIGTTTPNSRLHVLSSGTAITDDGNGVIIAQKNSTADQTAAIRIVGGSNAASFLTLGDLSSPSAGFVGYNNLSDRLSFGTSSSERMTISSGGNIGIGTTNPTTALEVQASATTDNDARYTIQSYDKTSAAQGVGGGIAFTGHYSGTTSAANFGSIKGIKENANVADYAGAMAFMTRVNGGLMTERMRITSGGNVGIGTTSPKTKLDVRGGLNLQDANNAAAIYFPNTGTFPNLYIRSDNDPSTYEAASECLFIGSNGNVGIGTTTPGAQLQVSSGGTYAGYFTTDKAASSAQVMRAEYTGTGNYDVPAVYGKSIPADYYGRGGWFVGGVAGVLGEVYPTGNNTYYGTAGYVSGGSGTNYGIWGKADGSGANYAGYFSGNVAVTGTLSKGGGSFKIDHPLDPENKYLYHSFVESPDMKNVYDGVIVLDTNGESVVELPSYFEALNRDFRYQLTCIGAFANVYVAEEVRNNSFKIAGGFPGLRVSWQVTGIRKDKFAEANRIQVEVDKPSNKRGKYLHPQAYGMGEDRGVDFATNKLVVEKK